MTELELQRMLCKKMKDIFDRISIWKKGEMKIFEHDIPDSTEFEGEEEKYSPHCIVRLVGGEIRKAGEPELVTADIYITTENRDGKGHREIITAVTRIRDELEQDAGIAGKFRMTHPLEWALDSDSQYLYASVRTRWQIAGTPFGAGVSRYL